MYDVQTTQLFCLSDPDYYDVPERLPDDETRFRLATCPVPHGWSRSDRGWWSVYRPAGVRPPDQGWKVHVSATPENAIEVLDTVERVCRTLRVSFKFLRSSSVLALVNGRYAQRSAAGKFVAIYPCQDQLAEVLEELQPALDGLDAPYVLGDLRIGAGPVHVRYGAFAEQWVRTPDGKRHHAIRTPQGELVPDERGVVFRVPEWASVPEVLRGHLAAGQGKAGPGFGYRVVRALHRTNSGSIYLATDLESQKTVVLREARPHAGLDPLGHDAIARLRRESQMLDRLQGLACVPHVDGTVQAWEHEFLVEEYVEGKPLSELMIRRNPLTEISPDVAVVNAYLDWVKEIIAGLSGAVASLHGRGVAFGDLHPGNVIVRPDGSLVLVDFEYAQDLNAPRTIAAGAPGYRSPKGTDPATADWAAVRAVWRAMMMPVPELTELDAGKAATMESFIRRRFGVGIENATDRSELLGPVVTTHSEERVQRLFSEPSLAWPQIREGLRAGILAAARPDRGDRLFPGDCQMFDDQEVSVAHGAAGILLALGRMGEPSDEHLQWLAGATQRTIDRSARSGGGRYGLYDGVAGALLALAWFGRQDQARTLLEQCPPTSSVRDAGLKSGQAGIALARLHLGRAFGDTAVLEEALAAAEALARVVRGEAGAIAPPEQAGLLEGMTGIAVLMLHAFRVTGDVRLLDVARTALLDDLGRCNSLPDGTVQVLRGSRNLLYLGHGAAGIAVVAREYLQIRDDDRLREFVDRTRRGCRHEFVREPGLFQGRAGFISALHVLGGHDEAAELHAHARRLGWHVVERDGVLLTPGTRLRRYSADLATGSAGLLWALESLYGEPGDLLPFLFSGLPVAVPA